MGAKGWGLAVGIVGVVAILGAFEAPDPDVDRIQEHLRTVVTELRSSPPASLTTRQAEARAETIRWLEEYLEAGVFPHNHVEMSGRVSVFLGPHGTPCAVGYLLLRSGQGAVVKEIAETNNLVRVPELKHDGRFLEWLEERGLTLSEAARIQPTYRPREGSPYAEETVALAIGTGLAAAYTELTSPREGSFEWAGLLNLATLGGHGALLIAAERDGEDSDAWETLTNAAGAVLAGIVATRRFNERSQAESEAGRRLVPLLGAQEGRVMFGVSLQH